MNVEQKEAYKCGVCGRTYSDKDFAEKCCKPKQCEMCGVELPTTWYMTVCEPCREKKCFDAATKMSVEEYEEKYNGNMVFHGDNYYSSVDDCLESLFSNCNDEEVKELFDSLKYIYGTESERVELDADNIICDMEENSNIEDFEVDKLGREDLEKFLDSWNKEYGTTCYSCSKVVIMITDELKKEYMV